MVRSRLTPPGSRLKYYQSADDRLSEQEITPMHSRRKKFSKKSPYNRRTMESVFWPFRPFCPFCRINNLRVFSTSSATDSVPGHHRFPAENKSYQSARSGVIHGHSQFLQGDKQRAGI